MTGFFITFEGGEGSGKSTQVKRLCDAFAKTKVPYIATREPGGTPAAERIRELLVKGNAHLDAHAETLLFYAARLEHVNTLIRPAVQSGKTVVCDRFADSTFVYQGIGKAVPEAFIQSLHTLVLADFAPDLTFVLDIDPELGLQRAGKRKNKETRFEALGLSFHRKVRDGFLAVARTHPDRCTVLDASQGEEALHAQILAIAKAKLNLAL